MPSISTVACASYTGARGCVTVMARIYCKKRYGTTYLLFCVLTCAGLEGRRQAFRNGVEEWRRCDAPAGTLESRMAVRTSPVKNIRKPCSSGASRVWRRVPCGIVHRRCLQWFESVRQRRCWWYDMRLRDGWVLHFVSGYSCGCRRLLG